MVRVAMSPPRRMLLPVASHSRLLVAVNPAPEDPSIRADHCGPVSSWARTAEEMTVPSAMLSHSMIGEALCRALVMDFSNSLSSPLRHTRFLQP
jgi:hypothetical protein